MKLTFHGGAGSVTGANYLLEAGDTKLVVECGLAQGGKFAEEENFEPFDYNPQEVDFALVTHAHVDHTGLLPKLVAEGFEGEVYSTEPTREFSRHLLEDSMSLLSRDAERCGAESFCTEDNLDDLFDLWKTKGYRKSFDLGSFEIEFFNSGHILGSSFIEVKSQEKSVVFSGDLGNSPAPLLKEKENLEELAPDYCLIESAYGGREHEDGGEVKDILEDVVEETVKAGGTLMIPAFAMERTQAILFHLHKLMENGRVPDVPVFLDSPLAIKLTDVYKQYKSFLDDETRKFLEEGNSLFDFPQLKRTNSVEESKRINEISGPKVVVAGSGMSQGGRIIHHEKRYLSDPNSSILFVGYQVEGSRGREILDGTETVEILGDEIPVRARVESVESYSAHADQPQLLSWLRPSRFDLEKVFVVQGEQDQSEALSQAIRDELAVEAKVPSDGETVDL